MSDFWKDYEPEPTKAAPMTTDRALDLALEWQNKDWNSESPMSADLAISEANDVINALMQALEAPVQEPTDIWFEKCFRSDTPAAQPAPVQEPVATLWQHGETGRTRITMPGDITDCDARWFKAADLYTTPPAQPAPVQEPVAWTNWRELAGAKHYQTPGWEMYADKRNPDDVALYTTPPAAQQEIQRLSALVRAQQITIEKLEAQRPWTGLTDEEIDEWTPEIHSVIRAIEAKLKEKNNG